MTTVVNPLRLRDELTFTDRLEHRFRGSRSQDAIDRRILALERWNGFANGNAIVTFELPNPKRLSPYAKVEVLKLSDSAYVCRKEYGTGYWGGFGPFDCFRVWPSAEKATRKGVGDILALALHYSRNFDHPASEQEILSKIIKECRAFLAPPQGQVALF